MVKRLGLFAAMSVVWLSVYTPKHLFGQESDSTKAGQSRREAWLNQPLSGKSEKTQGAIIAALGASSVVTGLIYLSQDDPCDDISGSNVFCTSNIDQVKITGIVALSLGVGGIVYGLLRYHDGKEKAKLHDDWRRKNKLSVRPILRYDGRRFDVGVSIALR